MLNALVLLLLLRRVGAGGPNILTVVVMRLVRPVDEAGVVLTQEDLLVAVALVAVVAGVTGATVLATAVPPTVSAA